MSIHVGYKTTVNHLIKTSKGNLAEPSEQDKNGYVCDQPEKPDFLKQSDENDMVDTTYFEVENDFMLDDSIPETNN